MPFWCRGYIKKEYKENNKLNMFCELNSNKLDLSELVRSEEKVSISEIKCFLLNRVIQSNSKYKQITKYLSEEETVPKQFLELRDLQVIERKKLLFLEKLKEFISHNNGLCRYISQGYFIEVSSSDKKQLSKLKEELLKVVEKKKVRNRRIEKLLTFYCKNYFCFNCINNEVCKEKEKNKGTRNEVEEKEIEGVDYITKEEILFFINRKDRRYLTYWRLLKKHHKILDRSFVDKEILVKIGALREVIKEITEKQKINLYDIYDFENLCNRKRNLNLAKEKEMLIKRKARFLEKIQNFLKKVEKIEKNIIIIEKLEKVENLLKEKKVIELNLKNLRKLLRVMSLYV